MKLSAGLVEAARTELAERHLHHFVRHAWPVLEPATPFVDNWHIQAVCEHLEAVAAGQIRRLIINIPPGFMKSLAVCVFWPCWVWLRQPATRWLFTSYSEGFAHRDAGKCLDLIRSRWYQERWRERFALRGEAVGRFANDKTGFRQATSVSGGGTGARADFVVTDDPLKIDEADSKAIREGVNHWWDSVMAGRGADPQTSRYVVVQQRLHEADLSGHLLAQGGYEHLFIPMEFESHRRCVTSLWRDPRQEDGELAWPGRFTRADVADWKKRLLGYGTAGQLQQRPEPIAEGAIYNRANFRYFSEEWTPDGAWWFLLRREPDQPAERVPAAACHWFQTVDTALKVQTANDYTAVGTFCVTPRQDLLVYDMVRDKVPVPLQYGFLLAARQRYPKVLFQAVEDAASGTGLIQQGVLQGMPFRALKVPGDKVTKAVEAATRYQSHTIFHRAGAAWLADFEQELGVFPKGAHDDMQDCLAYAALQARTDQLLRSGAGASLFATPADEKDECWIFQYMSPAGRALFRPPSQPAASGAEVNFDRDKEPPKQGVVYESDNGDYQEIMVNGMKVVFDDAAERSWWARPPGA